MNQPTLWSEEYYLDQIHRTIKSQISMKFYMELNRRPTKEEYENIWSLWIAKLKLDVTNYDLGIFND